jgi:hypothetical protein
MALLPLIVPISNCTLVVDMGSVGTTKTTFVVLPLCRQNIPAGTRADCNTPEMALCNLSRVLVATPRGAFLTSMERRVISQFHVHTGMETGHEPTLSPAVRPSDISCDSRGCTYIVDLMRGRALQSELIDAMLWKPKEPDGVLSRYAVTNHDKQSYLQVKRSQITYRQTLPGHERTERGLACTASTTEARAISAPESRTRNLHARHPAQASPSAKSASTTHSSDTSTPTRSQERAVL